MEAILVDYLVLESGVFLSALVLLLLAIGGVVLGYLADQEKAGKRFFWTESSLPEAELRDFLPREVLRAA
jgi:uncharacterized membrane protein